VMPYERLHAWRACHELTLATYRLTEGFPSHELYGLRSQMRRCAASAAANIAEGSAKRGAAELRRFADISVGSLAELSYFVLLARDLGYLTVEQWGEFKSRCAVAGRLTMALNRSLGRRKAAAAGP
jgi:four helix bundle protein